MKECRIIFIVTQLILSSILIGSSSTNEIFPTRHVTHSQTAIGRDCPPGFDDLIWFIDPLYNSVCGPRKVKCRDGRISGEQTCPGGGLFVSDVDPRCYGRESAEVRQNCHFDVECSRESVNIRIDARALRNQTPGVVARNCGQNFQDGSLNLRLKFGSPEFSLCGGRRFDDSDETIFTTDIFQHTLGPLEDPHVFGLRTQCRYPRSLDPATPDPVTLYDLLPAQLIQQSDYRALTFALQFMDGAFSQELGVPAVYTNDQLFVRGTLGNTPYLQDVRVSIRSCWATYGDNEDESYVLLTNRCANDSTFAFVTGLEYPDDPHTEDISFRAFRFYTDRHNYSQQVWLHCILVACELSDESSEMCSTSCPSDDSPLVSRHRRAPINTGTTTIEAANTVHMLRQEIRYLGDRAPPSRFPPVFMSAFAYSLLAASSAVLLITFFLVTIVIRWEYLLETRYKQKLSLRIKLFSAGVAHDLPPPVNDCKYIAPPPIHIVHN